MLNHGSLPHAHIQATYSNIPYRQRVRYALGPVHHSAPNCNLPCCNGFVRIEHLPALSRPHLTNPIHPLFAQARWYHGGSFDWRVLDQVLRLASNLLEAGLPWFHTVFFGAQRRLSGTNHNGGGRFELYPLKETITSTEKTRTRALLTSLARHVWFDARNPRHRGGCCCPDTQISAAQSTYFRGQNCLVVACRSLYDEVRHAVEGRLDSVVAGCAMVSLARVLLHEVGHAAVLARRPVTADLRGSTWYLQGERVAEEGFSLENFVFGGMFDFKYQYDFGHVGRTNNLERYRVNGVVSRKTSMIILASWPYHHQVKTYLEKRSHIDVRGNLEDDCVVWNVPFPYIHSLLQQRFWQESFAREGLAATRVKPVSGLRVSLPDWRYIDHQDNTRISVPRPAPIIPAGYTQLRSRLILRNDEAVRAS